MATYVQGQMDIDANLSLLADGEIEVIGRLVDASNASLFVKVSNGTSSANAIYKPIAGERPLWDFPDGNLASREVATYLVSRALNLNCVPPTILRDGPFGLGSLQLWIDECEKVGERYLLELPGLRKLALLDAVVNNTDRKIGHLLFKGDQIYGCDHGVTFHEEYKLRTVLWQFADKKLTEDELQLLRTFDCNLSEYLTNTEMKALSLRIDTLIKEERFPLPPTDWPAIPWPPF